MAETKWTPGPWRWQGEDYRGGWGWQILVGPDGQGLIVGEDSNSVPCEHLRSFMPVDPALCITGLVAEGRPRVRSVHVLQPEAKLIAAAPDLYAALSGFMDIWGSRDATSDSQRARQRRSDLMDMANAALAKARGENA
jgi:hypothetical protein